MTTLQYPPKKLRHLQNSMRHFPDLQWRYTLLFIHISAVFLYMKDLEICHLVIMVTTAVSEPSKYRQKSSFFEFYEMEASFPDTSFKPL
jgi:hypothetical protein